MEKINIQPINDKQKIFFKKNWFLMLELSLMFAICWLHALAAGHYTDFHPINGTFQNFNPVRRLLDGQIPYKDFSDYLGMGHLYLGSLFTAILGGDYQASLVAFSFLTILSMAALSSTIGKAVFKNWETAIGITNIVLAMLVIQPLFFVNGLALTEDIKTALNSALKVGNSARFFRGLILPLCVIMFGFLFHIYKKKEWNIKKKKYSRYIPAIGAGCLAGFAFTWSNDYGISCFVCIGIMTFWISLSRKRKVTFALINTGIEIIASLISLLLFVEIFTLGHFLQWFKTTFGTGGYQSWYYNSDKSYYLYDIDLTYIILIQAFMAMIYMLILFKKKGSTEAVGRYGVLGFANMVAFCAVNEYKLLSGGRRYEVALAILFLTILCESIHLLSKLYINRNLRNSMLITSLVVCLAWTASTSKDELLFRFATEKDGEYISCMGGNMTSLYTDLAEAHEFLDGEEFFSTYASAQEVMEGKFQPSGTDYIIHVLGDEQRKKYLTDFINGDFKYTATIRKEYTDWEYWAERANWFFYRELYQHWHPVFANTYEIYWERNERDNEYTLLNNYDITIQSIDFSTVKLILQTDKSINGIADIYIDYSVDKNPASKLAKLLFRQALKIENSGIISATDKYYESNYLRNESAEYIPMPVTNGYGELTLTACPAKSVILNLKKVSCNSIYVAIDTWQAQNKDNTN